MQIVINTRDQKERKIGRHAAQEEKGQGNQSPVLAVRGSGKPLGTQGDTPFYLPYEVGESGT